MDRRLPPVSDLPTFGASVKKTPLEIDEDALAKFNENTSIPFKSLLASDDIQS